MNVFEGLQQIRGRLVENGAQPETIQAVDLIMKRAALPAASPANAQSLLQLVRMLMRTPASSSNVRIYNDLVRLEEELESAATTFRERAALEDARPTPKDKKYYKKLKEKERTTD